MRWRYGIVGAAVVVCVLLATAPATLLERMVPDTSAVRLAACSGSVWSGACGVFLAGRAGWLPAGVVSFGWRFTTARGWHLDLAQDGRPAAVIAPAFAGWTLTGVDLRASVTLAAALSRNAAALAPRGQVAFTAPALACNLTLSRCSGKARIALSDLVLAALAGEVLGSYALDLDLAAGGRLGGKLSTLAGPVTLVGDLDRPTAGGVRLSGRATAAAGTPEGIRRALAETAKPEGPDAYVFSWTLT